MVYFHCSFIYLFTGQLCCDRDYAKTSTANIKFSGQGEEHVEFYCSRGSRVMASSLAQDALSKCPSNCFCYF